MERKFNPEHLARLNDPAREQMLPPDVLWKGFGVDHPRTVIDLGAGTGFFATRFAPRLASGGTLYACDTNPLMVAWMREHLSEADLDRISPLEIAESAVGLPDGCADLVYLVNVYHELADAPRMLLELARLLAPGAPLAVVDWKHEPMSHGPPLERRVEASIIQRQLVEAGFRGVGEPVALPLHVFLTGRRG